MTTVSVRTHTYTTFANPYLLCTVCGATVHRFHDGDRCGCQVGSWSMPCQHTAATVSACPSWNPVDECGCGPEWGRIHEETWKGRNRP